MVPSWEATSFVCLVNMPLPMPSLVPPPQGHLLPPPSGLLGACADSGPVGRAARSKFTVQRSPSLTRHTSDTGTMGRSLVMDTHLASVNQQMNKENEVTHLFTPQAHVGAKTHRLNFLLWIIF